jgi:hypothetical protein
MDAPTSIHSLTTAAPLPGAEAPLEHRLNRGHMERAGADDAGGAVCCDSSVCTWNAPGVGVAPTGWLRLIRVHVERAAAELPLAGSKADSSVCTWNAH